MSIGTTLSFAQCRAAREVPPRQLIPALSLAPRHIKTAQGIARGLRNCDIADELGITEGTLKVYVSELYSITGLDSRVKVAQWVNTRESAEYGQAMEAIKCLRALEVPV